MYHTKIRGVNKEASYLRERVNIAGLPLTILACWLLLVITGCGSDDGRITITGTVTLDGEMLPDGSISLRPMMGTSGPTAGGKITNGSFSIPSDKGVMPGSYRVEITASRETGKEVMDTRLNTMMPEIIQYVPTKYNRESELTADITEAGPNQFEFQLTSE